MRYLSIIPSRLFVGLPITKIELSKDIKHVELSAFEQMNLLEELIIDDNFLEFTKAKLNPVPTNETALRIYLGLSPKTKIVFKRL